MPVIFYFRTFGNVESQTGKDINDFVLYNGERVACTEFHRISRTRQIPLILLLPPLVKKRLYRWQGRVCLILYVMYLAAVLIMPRAGA